MASIVVVSNLLPGIASRFEGHVVDTINTALLQVVERADPNTPVDTGQLKAAKQITFASGGNPSGEIVWTAEYSAFVHNGTYRMAPRPFAGDAVDAVTPGYLAAMAELGL